MTGGVGNKQAELLLGEDRIMAGGLAGSFGQQLVDAGRGCHAGQVLVAIEGEVLLEEEGDEITEAHGSSFGQILAEYTVKKRKTVFKLPHFCCFVKASTLFK